MEKNSHMKTVAIFSAYVPPHLGGIERYIDNLSKELLNLGVRPIIVTSNFNNEIAKEIKNGILIIRLPVYKLFKNRYPIVNMNSNARKLLKELNNYSIDAIIVNTRFHLTSHIGADYGEKHNIPVYLIEHGSNYVTLDNKFIDFFANRYEDFLTWRLKKKVKGFYGVSKSCAKWLENFGIVASGTWYNSIDCDQTIPLREHHDGITFLYAGRLIKQKGVENILESYKYLKEKYDSIYLTIAGDGPEFEIYKDKYEKIGVVFTGKLNYEELKKQYSKTDVFLYPPLWPEGLPTSILESGLMGCAVIGTPMGGITEILNDHVNGLIVGPELISLRNGMEELINNSELRNRLATELYKTVTTKFSWKETAKQVIKDIGL